MKKIGYFTLEDYQIIAGETATLQWTLKDSSGNNYDAVDWTGTLDIGLYAEDSDSIITKTLSFSSVSSVRCLVSATLAPTDTKTLDGLYIYQLTLKNAASQSTIYQGLIEISHNINEAGVS